MMTGVSNAAKGFRKKTGFKNSVEFARFIREKVAEEMETKAKHKKTS